MGAVKDKQQQNKDSLVEELAPTLHQKCHLHLSASVQTVVGRVLQRLAVEPAPANWQGVLRPAHDLFAAGLEVVAGDDGVDVEAVVLVVIAGGVSTPAAVLGC